MTEWNEVDDGPRWIDIEESPYRGGGVMSRRRTPDEVSERDDKTEALRKQCVTIRKLHRDTRHLKVGSNGHTKKLHDLQSRLRDAAIMARHLGLGFEDIQEMGKPGWRP